MTDLSGFDAYCDEHNIQPGEEPAAFGAYLHSLTGWDGKQTEVTPAVTGKYSELPEPVAEAAPSFVGTIHIPLETDPLSLNKKLHWATEAKLKKQWRRFAGLNAARYPALAKVDVTLTWFFVTNRVRDEDNMARLLKSLCDGLVDAGVVPDDSPQYMGKKCRIERSPERTVAYMELRVEAIA